MLLPICLFSQVKYELPCNKQLLQKSHCIARSQIGVTEKTGKNDGKQVEMYLASVGLSKGNPYCAAGQYWCFKEAARLLNLSEKLIPIKKTGSTFAMFNAAMQKGKKVKYISKQNDLLFWIITRTGHVERIDSVTKGGWVYCIGFNTGLNTREGSGVEYKLRNIYHVLSRMKVRGIIGFEYE